MNCHQKLLLLLLIVSFSLISWGPLGHQAVGYIAESHLTPVAAQKIKELLGNETLADVSTYADELRPDTNFNFMAPWHYIDVPPNEDFSQFEISVYTMKEPNVYSALQHWEKVLSNPKANRSLRIFALKMIVHLVGDLHQPLHVARSEDKGGNLLPVWFGNDSTSFHWMWDTKLIEHRGLSSKDFASLCDTAGPVAIIQWQSDSLINWLYESNQICNQLYKQNPKGRKFGEDYYNNYIGLIEKRIDQAGIRLAGVLNLCLN
jgi:S1/P1 Nuclease